MRSETFLKIFIGFFVLMFFGYLFSPLILMSMTAFNSSEFPRVSPWNCFTFEWFDVLVSDKTLTTGFFNSLWIGLGVVLLSVPIGLVGAIMLTQIRGRIRSVYYTIVISPILVPGVVLGISTLIFWDRMGVMFDAGYKSFFYNGIFLTIVGQATFISAYTMLVFIARLQRFDTAQEEAALDLGATHVQTFFKILLPFMKPAIGSAAVLAFLASFENYNTTVFTIVSESTLTTVLASKVRYGINPSISALAVLIVAVTLLGAIVYEVMRQREAAREAAAAAEGKPRPAPLSRAALAQRFANPAAALVTLAFVAGLGTVYMAAFYDTPQCKIDLAADRELERRIRDTPGEFIPRIQGPSVGSPASPGSEQYEGVFDPKSLEGQAGTGEPGGEGETKSPGAEQYKSIFDPGNLQGQAGGEQEGGEGETKSPGAEQYKSIFDPGNLQSQSGTEEGGEAPETEEGQQ
jgi:spermidine/putrescine transport system permease protein